MEKQHKSNKTIDQTIQKKGEQSQDCCRLKRKLQRQKSMNSSSSKFIKHYKSHQPGARGQIWSTNVFYTVHKNDWKRKKYLWQVKITIEIRISVSIRFYWSTAKLIWLLWSMDPFMQQGQNLIGGTENMWLTNYKIFTI